MKSKFLFLAAVIVAIALNASAEENISSVSAGIQEYQKKELNLSDINADINTLNKSIEKIEQEITLLNDKKDTLVAEIEKENAETIDIEHNTENTKNDITNLESKKNEFDSNKGYGYKIASMLPAFIAGLWISIIILIFAWKGE